MPPHDPTRRRRRSWSPERIAADPQYPHGTPRGYNRGCSCEPCRRANARQRNVYKVQAAAGEPASVPAAEVTAHLAPLLARGVSPFVIADLAALDHTGTIEIVRGERQYVQRATARALFTVTWDVVWREGPPDANIDATKAAQQVRSLVALGYPLRWVADRLGHAGQTAPSFIAQHKSRVSLGMARRVAALAAEVGDRQGPSERSRKAAVRKGWFPPGAYDEDGRLIPGAARTPENLARDVKVAKAERQSEVQRLAAEGVPTAEIAERLGISRDLVLADAKRPLSRVGAAALAERESEAA